MSTRRVRRRRWWQLLAGSLLLGLVGGVAPASTGHSSADRADVLARGAYLSRIGDCAGCHTRNDGVAFAGGRAVPTPFGTIYAPNITADRSTGIGDWSADQFWDALHNGVRADGALLYPAFPYVAYTKVRRVDVDAIFAYLQSLPPVRRARRKNTLEFPYGWRPILLAWRSLFFNAGEYRADPAHSPAWNRGAYLVQGLGHCQACHTPRNGFGAVREKAALAGGMIPVQHWYAPSLVAPGGASDWPPGQLATFLKTGTSAHDSAYGPMAEVVQNSLQYLHDDDVHAIVVYLQSLPQRAADASVPAIRPPPRQAADLFNEGKKIYAQHCAACHQDAGTGVALVYPSLVGDASITAGWAVNAIRVVLLGGFAPATAGNPRPYSMPAFSRRLDDRQVAAVVTYIRQAWDNKAAAVSPQSVRKYRSTPSP